MAILQTVLATLPLSICASLLAGLLGIGGGLLTVPIVTSLLEHHFGFIPYMQQITIGTSFAVMCCTLASSAIMHHYQHNISWLAVKSIIVYLIIGTILGSIIAPYIPSKSLQFIFALFCYFIAVKNLFKSDESMTDMTFKENKKKSVSVVFFIGLLASWLGIGGGSMLIPFLLKKNLSIKKTIGTSATLAFPISLSATISYVLSGLPYQTILPAHSIGFVYFPYFISLALGMALFAPIGAKLSIIASPVLLRRLLTTLHLFIGSKTLWSVFYT